MSERPTEDVYFMGIAVKTSERATCPRRHVGCVLVRDGSIVSTGYNGSMRKRPHCEDVGCLLIDNHCERTVHAEANAIDSAAKEGARTGGATAYVTAFPCWNCFKQLVNAGIVRIVYGSPYVDRVGDMVRPEAEALGLPLVELLGVVPAPTTRAGEPTPKLAPGSLHIGMTYAEVKAFDFGDCGGPRDCACAICSMLESLTCVCRMPYVDHYDDGTIALETGTLAGPKGCDGFSLASWLGMQARGQPEMTTIEDTSKWRIRSRNKVDECFFWHFDNQEVARAFFRPNNDAIRNIPGEWDASRVFRPKAPRRSRQQKQTAPAP